MRNLLSLLLCCTILTVNAQDYAFKVLISKGQNEAKSESSPWHLIKVGEALQLTDEVRVAENSYIGLIHSSGKPFEVKDPGPYSVAKLSSQVKGSSSVISKYTDFILSSETEKKQRLAATGAVHRGERADFQLYLPEPGIDQVFGNDITISWEYDKGMAPYQLVFKNLYGDELLSISSDSSSAEIDLNQAKLKGENTLLVSVIAMGKKNKKSAEKSIKRLPDNVKQDVAKLLQEFGENLDDESPINKYVLGGFYEERGLIVDALSNYSEAMALAPEVTDFKKAYADFLVRLELKK